MKFACTIVFSATVDEIFLRHLCHMWNLPRLTKGIHLRVVGLRLEGILVLYN